MIASTSYRQSLDKDEKNGQYGQGNRRAIHFVRIIKNGIDLYSKRCDVNPAERGLCIFKALLALTRAW